MSNTPSPSKVNDSENRPLVTRYTRPIEFVAQSTSTKEPETKRLKSNGDAIASIYRSLVSSTKNRTTEPNTVETWKCESCDMLIPKSDYKRHIQGTAHMVSSETKYPAPDILTLNGNNVGFKMLQSQGWQYEEGLGLDRQGRRHPIATVLKQDRLCIGHQETSKKAVTHKYKEIEKKAIERQRILSDSQKDPGKEIAKRAKTESETRAAILRYMKN
jgi:hypothetical protein